MEILRFLSRGRARLLLPLVVSCVATSSIVMGAASAAADVAPDAGGWLRPVEGAVVRAFVAPASEYSAGHRGVDFAAPSGTPVRAANDGVVSFAGTIAGTLHVTVTHPGGLRTSYSFLASLSVREGQAVARGDVVGTAGGTGPDHDGSVLHFGLRVGDRYVDPMQLFRPGDLSKLVHLVPTHDPAETPWSSAAERRELQSSLHLAAPGSPAGPSSEGGGDSDSCGSGVPLVGAALDAVCDVGGWLGDEAEAALDAGLEYLDRSTDLASSVLDGLREPLHQALDSMRKLSADFASELARTPTGVLALDLVEIGRRLVKTVTAECSDHDPPADGTGGSGHRVMVVAGLDSGGPAGAEGPTVDLDVRALGYHPDEGEVRYFSYAADGGAYTARDTHGPLEVAAARLAIQLRAMQREQPGREVDLIAHSQGGVVVDYFLTHLYRAWDRTLPPLGIVITLSSPHQGAPLATAAAEINAAPLGPVALDGLAQVASLAPASGAVQELDEHSAFMEHLWDRGLPEHIDFTTIGATEDLIVPASQISVPRATETIVAGDNASQHSGILHDPDALRAVRAALEGNAPPCVGIGTALRSAITPVFISQTEHLVGSHAAASLGGSTP